MSRLKSHRGSILVTVLFITSVLALLVAAVATDSFQSMKSVSQSGRDTQAKYAAYAGMEIVLNELRQQERYTGEEQIGPGHGKLSRNMKGLEHLRYEVEIWNNIQERDSEGKPTGEASDMAGPNDVIVRPDTVFLVSSGKDMDRGEEVLLSSLAGTARRIRPIFEDAAYARSKLVLTGGSGLVDAWDSAGGYTSYVAGKFPGEGGPDEEGDDDKGKDDDGVGAPTVADYEATLGTDSLAGRTMRLLGGARLNGHFRVGPGAGEKELFGEDTGDASSDTSGSDDGGSSEQLSFAISTSTEPDNVAGKDPGAGGGLGEEKAVSDDKSTEVPKYVSPISGEDVIAGPTLSNPPVPKKDILGKPVKDLSGNTVMLPPEPVALAPGGYDKVKVPNDQTLVLTAGVYFFRDDFDVNGGTVLTSGSGPVIVFCGKKANFHNATVNEGGRTSGLQLCFTDEIEDEAELDATIESLENVLSGPIQDSQIGDPEDYFKNLVSPAMGTDSETNLAKRRGFSKLAMTGSTKFYGSISGTNLVAEINEAELFGSIMGNIVSGENAKLHQDLALKGSNVMAAGGWQLEGVHQLR